MTTGAWGCGALLAPATNIVPVRQPVLAIGHTHVDPPHRDSPARYVAGYLNGLAAAYPIGRNTDTRMTSRASWRLTWRRLYLAKMDVTADPAGHIASQKLP